jgi:hypothetical protein
MDNPNTTTGTLGDPNATSVILQDDEDIQDILTYTVPDEAMEAAAGMVRCSTINTMAGIKC